MEVNHTQTNFHMFLAGNDPKAWEEFYLVYFDMMIWWACQWGCSHDEARDLAQEKVVQLFTRDQFSSFQSRGKHSFRGWLKRIITNEARTYLQRARRQVSATNSEGDDIAVETLMEAGDRIEPEWDSEDQDYFLKCSVNRALRSTIARRSQREYEVFLSRVIRGLSPAELKESMDLDRGAQDVYLSRFRKALRQELDCMLNDQKNYLGSIGEACTQSRLLQILKGIYQAREGRLDTLIEQDPLIVDHEHDSLRALLRLVAQNPPPSTDRDWLLVMEGGEKDWHELRSGLKIGRNKANDIQLVSRGVSGIHASIQQNGDSWLVRDENSTNHVYINSKRIGAESWLLPGDWMQISDCCIIVVGRVSANFDE